MGLAALLMNVALAQASKPKVLEQRVPAYPAAEEAARHGGRVVLRVMVKEDGAVETVYIASSTGFPGLDQAAVDSVRTWRFAPATDEQGKPVAGTLSFALTFKPPRRELDHEITCAQLIEQAAALRANSPEASLEQLPALGAIKDLAEAVDEVLPADLRGRGLVAEMPQHYQQLLTACAQTPDAKVMEIHAALIKTEEPAKKRRKK
jgi:TonB family protein